MIYEFKKLGEITFYALNLNSIKKSVKLHKPIICEIGYVLGEHQYDLGPNASSNSNVLKNKYLMIEMHAGNKSICGHGFYKFNYSYDDMPSEKELQNELIENNGKNLREVITNGLAMFRTTLKHMHTTDLIDLVGEVQPKIKNKNEIYDVIWLDVKEFIGNKNYIKE